MIPTSTDSTRNYSMSQVTSLKAIKFAEFVFQGLQIQKFQMEHFRLKNILKLNNSASRSGKI